MPPFSQVIEQNSLAGTAVLIKGGRCILTAVRAANTTSADAYVQVFDAASAAAVTPGTTVARWWVMTDFGAGDVSLGDGLPTEGVVFVNGIVAISTTTVNGATGATQHVRFCIV